MVALIYIEHGEIMSYKAFIMFAYKMFYLNIFFLVCMIQQKKCITTYMLNQSFCHISGRLRQWASDYCNDTMVHTGKQKHKMSKFSKINYFFKKYADINEKKPTTTNYPPSPKQLKCINYKMEKYSLTFEYDYRPGITYAIWTAGLSLFPFTRIHFSTIISVHYRILS